MTQQRSRFSCASSSLTLSRLLIRSRRVLLFSLTVGVLFHLALGGVNVLQQEQKAVKPLTTQFVKRQPRLTKPLEMKKKPAPRRRTIRRQMVSAKPRVSRRTASPWALPTRVVDNLARPKAAVSRSVFLEAPGEEPRVVAAVVRGTREPERALNMSLEMLNVQALDTGQYHAMVIFEPDDRRDIRGFFRVALAYSPTMAEAALDAKHGNYVARMVGAYVRLVDAMNRYTHVKTAFSDRFAFDSEELTKVPWIYAPAGALTFRISEGEARGLGRYMLAGGFLLCDDLGHQKGRAGDVSLRQVFKDALETQGYRHGVEWTFEVLPNAHRLYHCFFDFDQGPPRSWSTQGGYWMSGGEFRAPPDPTLDGVEIENRLLGIMSNQAFANAWGDWNHRSGYMGLDPTRPLQFGVNTIIFALTQEGSITNRVMNIVR